MSSIILTANEREIFNKYEVYVEFEIKWNGCCDPYTEIDILKKITKGNMEQVKRIFDYIYYHDNGWYFDMDTLNMIDPLD